MKMRLFALATALFAAGQVQSVVITAKPVRTEGAGFVEFSGTNVSYSIAYLKNGKGDGLSAQRAKGSVTSFWFDDYDIVRVDENCPHQLCIATRTGRRRIAGKSRCVASRITGDWA